VPWVEQEGEPIHIEGLGSDLDSVTYSGDKRPEKGPTEAHMSILVLGGVRSFDREQWEPVNDQLMLGAELGWVAASIPVGFELGAGTSYSEEDKSVFGDRFTFTGSSWDVHGGLRFEVNPGDGPLLLYGGIGLSYLEAEFKAKRAGIEVSDSDSSVGYYVHFGLLLQLGLLSLGADIHSFTGTTMTLYDSEVDADFVQVALALGLRF